MKQSLFLFMALCFVITSLYAQETKDTTLVISFNKTTHDYGTIEQGGDGNSVFTFTNKGKTPLILSNVSSSCGCTVPAWPREPIEPGKTGIIKIQYNTNLVGTFSKTITVNSNAKNASVILIIKGTVKAKQ